MTLAAAVGSLLHAQPAVDRRLTTTDVEKAAGVTGVKLVPRGAQTGAGGDLNFARADGKLILMINVGDAKLYTKAREQKEVTGNSGSSYYGGVGEGMKPLLTEARLKAIAQRIFSRG